MKILILLLFLLPLTLFSQNDYITNKDYNEFVTYVRDSLLRRTMGEEVDEEEYVVMEINKVTGKWEIIAINWKSKLDVNWPESREALEPWYYKPLERTNRKREFDTRKFIHNGIKVYPDVMIWCRDSTVNKSWAIFLSKYYFTHPYFENYPVYGLFEQQIQEYVNWKYPKVKRSYNKTEIKEINLTLQKEKLQFTVGDYYEFYKYTRDSTFRMLLCKELDEERYCISVNKFWEEISPPIVKWKHKIEWKDEEAMSIFKEVELINTEGKVDNRIIMYDYSWLNYYRAITLPDSTIKKFYFGRMAINISANKYIKEFSPINIKKELKNKNEVDYSGFISGQIRAFYYWKKSKYPKKDVFDGFIPYGNHTSWEENSEHFIDDNDMELLRTGKLPDSFYHFKISIPTITLK